MTITIEDGTGVTGANSYATEAELALYAADRGIDLTTAEGVLLIKAMDYIESLDYTGTKATQAQPLQWPRASVMIDGYSIGSNEIPAELVNGLLAAAVSIDQGVNPLADIERSTKREKVGDLEIEYADGAASVAINKTIKSAMRKILTSAGGATFVVSRA